MANSKYPLMEAMKTSRRDSLLNRISRKPNPFKLTKRNNPMLPLSQPRNRSIHMPMGRIPAYISGIRPIGRGVGGGRWGHTRTVTGWGARVVRWKGRMRHMEVPGLARLATRGLRS